MRDLSIDVETYSDISIKDAGLYRYAESKKFEILLCAYSVDFGEVQVVDFSAGEKLPQDIYNALNDKSVTKHAFNAAFEITCLNRAGFETSADQWLCTMIYGLYLGYPAGLDNIGRALNLPEDKTKLREGKSLIRLFCTPNKDGKRILPCQAPEKWQRFKEYNRQDVVAETEIFKRLRSIPIPDWVRDDWSLDYEVNRRGIKLDRELIEGALSIDDEYEAELTAQAKQITGLPNPNSRNQLLAWLQTRQGFSDLPDLTKETVAAKLARVKDTDDKAAVEMLKLRQKLAKSSISKYKAMEAVISQNDDRARGLLQYYGSHTGRWSGRLIQGQNLPRNYLENLDTARELVKAYNLRGLEFLYGDPSDTLSQLIRTAFIAKDGHTLAVADFSAIEARVLSWLAGEEWRLKVFRTTGKIYEAAAAMMFDVPEEKIVKGNPEYELRAKGKIAELALGYQGGVGALVKMGALKMGLPEKELPKIVMLWRAKCPAIYKYWHYIEKAALNTLLTGTDQYNGRCNSHTIQLRFSTGQGADGGRYLSIDLPSGRSIYYPNARIINGKIYYWLYQEGKWKEASTYGGKLVENITQAVARDCLAISIRRLNDAGYIPLMHIHDEVVCEVPIEKASVAQQEMEHIMGTDIAWAKGLPLKAAGFVSPYYKKD